MPKLSFISDEVVRIDLEQETWVEARREMSYDEFVDILAGYKQGSTESENLKIAMRILEKVLKNWSDTEHPCTPENIRKLSIPVVIAIADKVMAYLNPEKKSSQS